MHEWVTGGGLAGSELPPSWAAEGRAMCRAIAGDFAALDEGCARVIVTLDDRLDDDPGPWTIERISPDDGPDRLIRLARDADHTVLIAPETTGILERLTRQVLDAGARLLGSAPDAIAMAGDKAALAVHLAARGIETPPSRVVVPREGLPENAQYPAVLKPIDGAGAIDTFLLEGPDDLPDAALGMSRALLQPLVSGRPMSASYLVDAEGRAWPLAVGEQDVIVRGGRFRYRGGRLPVSTRPDTSPMQAAVESIRGLRGFVGVDFLWDDCRQRATVLEINPRPTTSIVGLVRLLPPGRLARAWIDTVEPALAGAADLSELAERLRARRAMSFDASGTILDAEGRQ